MEDLKVTLGLIPDNCSEHNAVEISEMSITYSQPHDCCSDEDDFQHLTITARNGGTTEYEWYYDLSIPEGEHWSVESGTQIKDLVDDFQKRMEINTTHSDDLETYKHKRSVPK